MILTRCDVHYCAICDCDVVHTVQDGICAEPEETVCEACWAQHDADDAERESQWAEEVQP